MDKNINLLVDEGAFWNVNSVVDAPSLPLAIDPAKKTALKIDSFARLPVGWNHRNGGPIDGEVLKYAKAWNSFLHSQGAVTYTDAAPGDQSVAVGAGLLGEHYLEVITEIDGHAITFSVAHDYKKKQQFYRVGLSLSAAMKLVSEVIAKASAEVREASWKALTWSTQHPTISQKASFTGMPLQTTGAGFHTWTPLASLHPGSPSALTYAGTFIVQMTTTTPLFSGALIPRRSTKTAA